MYLFLLGRNPELSVLEIDAYLTRKKEAYSVQTYNPTYALINAVSLPEEAIHDLGGTVLIAKECDLSSLVLKTDKLRYALLTYGKSDAFVDKEIKEMCREQRVKTVRKYASAEKHIPTKWADLDYVFIACREGMFVAQSISQPKKYKQRDETRPVFDPVAVTSIRLAKMLVNMAQAEREILDPFCGTGTILQEALLMDYTVIGIDKNIDAAKKNLRTLGKQYEDKISLHEGLAENRIPLLESVEAVVTEPYMGPYLKKLPTEREAKEIVVELTTLYSKILKALASVVTGRIVIIIPSIRTFTKKHNLPMERLIAGAGLKIVSNTLGIDLPIPYHKKQSKVERTIYILESASS